MKKFSILGALLLLLATATLTLAQTAAAQTLKMNAVEGSKVTGTAVVTQVGSGITVSVKLSGYASTVKKSDGHIHSGTCEAQGPVTSPLTAIVPDASGNGAADTTLAAVGYAGVADGNHYVQYHEASAPPGKQVSCANILKANATAGQGGGSGTTAPAAAPATGLGGTSNGTDGLTLGLLAALLLVVTGATTGLAVARRRK